MKPKKKIVRPDQKKKVAAAKFGTKPRDKNMKNVFKITPQYVKIINNTIKRIGKRTEPIRILFVCQEGFATSVIGKNNFNDLAATLNISGKITAGQDSFHLEHHSSEQLKKVDYIVPKYVDEAAFARMQYSNKCHGGKAEILSDGAFSKGSAGKPKTYRSLLLAILRKEAKKAAKQ